MSTGMGEGRPLTRYSQEEFVETVAHLRDLAEKATTNDEMKMLTSRIAQITRIYRIQNGLGLLPHPAEQARELDSGYMVRPHLAYLSEAVARATRDVERGKNRKLAVSMPPRAGKSLLVSQYMPLWLLRRHPDWKIVMTSYDAGLTAMWSREVRTLIEHNPDLGIALDEKSRGWSSWETVEGGGIFTTSTGGSLTGRGAKVLIIDDPVKDFVEAHSASARQRVWDWWLSVAQTRLEPPSLVISVQTRWHEDDFTGRLLSSEYEGNPREWEKIVLPAIAGPDDLIGREQGEPLLSPIVDETRSEALDRWDDVKRAVGSYVFSALYQQSPAPAQGAIFDSGWWRFWTTDPQKVTEDGKVVLVDPGELKRARWIDSWDTSFKGAEGSDYVVGQRWVRSEGNRYLVEQTRGRWSFVETVERMKKWARSADPGESPYGDRVHERYIEETANGPAIIETLKEKVSGIKPVRPSIGKEARARAITPEIESGNVYLPHPTDPGKAWVQDLLSELRNFPHDMHDDQVDALTQGLAALRETGRGRVSVPGARSGPIGRDISRAALSDIGRQRGGAAQVRIRRR